MFVCSQLVDGACLAWSQVEGLVASGDTVSATPTLNFEAYSIAFGFGFSAVFTVALIGFSVQTIRRVVGFAS